MISQLTGTVVHKDLQSIILDVNGVGYKIAIGADTFEQLKGNPEKVRFWTYLAVRENSLDLYGFLSEEGLDFFELLIGISGIGPKTAKLIVVSLAGKLVGVSTKRATTTATGTVTDSVTVALIGLGWPERVALQAVEDAIAVATDTDRQAVPALLRLALANLGPQAVSSK